MLESELFGRVRGAFTGAVENKEGLLRTAGAGTIFLDLLGDMPPSIQAKLLRAGGHEHDHRLGARLGETAKELVPVRPRHADVGETEVEGRPRSCRTTNGLTDRRFATNWPSRDALRLLAGHGWRGNIRELSNAIERGVIFAKGTEIVPADLPETVRAAAPRDPHSTPNLRVATAEFERAHILRVIEECGGNRRKAARLLGLGVTSPSCRLGAPNGA